MKRTAVHASYMRDMEHVRRLKEALSLDKTIPDDVRSTLILACELLHGTIAAHPDGDTMRVLSKSKLAQINTHASK